MIAIDKSLRSGVNEIVRVIQLLQKKKETA